MSSRKRSLTAAGIPIDTVESFKKIKLNGGAAHSKSKGKQFMDLCDECLTLCFKFLSPKERIKCFLLSPLLHHTMTVSDNKSIWNDMRLLLKHTTDPDAVTIKLIHSVSSYPKSYKNCIAIYFNEYCQIRDELTQNWIFECITNIETFANNASFYNSKLLDNFQSFDHVKYFTFDCVETPWNKFEKIFVRFPNLSYLSFLNLGHKLENANKYSIDCIFDSVSSLSSLQHFQFYDCAKKTFSISSSAQRIKMSYLSQIISLDLCFCSFGTIGDVQNMMNLLKELRYLSFVSNGIDRSELIRMSNLSMSECNEYDIDYDFETLQVPETLVYLKYFGEILNENWCRIELGLEKLSKTQSLAFLDCNVEDMVLLDGVSKHCSDCLQFISFNCDGDCIGFLEKYWMKYRVFEKKNDNLQIGMNYVERTGDGLKEADCNKLRYFLNRICLFKFECLCTRNEIYRRYFEQEGSDINAMAKLNEATDFFQW